MEYNFRDIEKKWQARWAADKTFRAENDSAKPKYYVLDMFPYPSGAGLHVGHPLGYIASDIVARYKRLKGFNVLHPMGYDSFGLPAEQYAIQTGQHPAITTEKNIARYREQMDKIGFSFDWEREVRTSDPSYYKWTQWIFIQLFNSWYNKKSDKAEKIEMLIGEFEKSGNANVNAVCDEEVKNFSAADWKNFSEKERSDMLMHYRLAYLGEAIVNWCPQLGTVLANEEVKDGVSERGGYPVERKSMPQWSLRITAYAERLLSGLDGIDWSEAIKEQQRNWIGKSEGSSVRFRLIPSPSPQEKGMSPDKNSPPEFATANKEIWGWLKSHSKEHRKNQTKAEAVLWERLRDKRLGCKFRRQHVIDSFIADFVCLEKKLIVEVDGDIHLSQKEYDAQRTLILNEIGFVVTRFTNEEVIHKTDWVCNEIKSLLEGPPSPVEKETEDEAAIEVFTTRPDTIFGVTFLTLAPENELVQHITTAEQKKAVEEYVNFAKNRSERERMADVKKITGVFTGAYAIHPFTGKNIPVWVGDYVLAGYGTGAVMGVPAHDTRDFAFAKHFGIEITRVIQPDNKEQESEECFDTYEGKCINSDFLNGLSVKDAIKRAIAEIEKKGIGKGKVNYRLRDAVFGRQRYWGEPIPVYYEDGIPKTMEEKDLPLELPKIDKFLPTETGEPPLARAQDWKYKGKYEYEKTTMPGWAGSSWYYLRYMDPHNDNAFAGKDALEYWKDVDLYIGGAEHATGHLLYVRFWTKFLKDLGYISIEEPARKLINQGMIQGESAFVYGFGMGITFTPSKQKKQGLPKLKKLIVPKSSYDNFKKNGSDILLSQLVNNRLSELKEEGWIEVTQDHKLTSLIPIHIDINLINPLSNELHIENFKKSERFKSLLIDELICEENGKYIVGREIEKMSKSKYNVVTPDTYFDEQLGMEIPGVIDQYGADCLRLYEMFLGPLEQSKPWNTNGISGVYNFLKKYWKLFHTTTNNEQQTTNFSVSEEVPSKQELKALHKTIKKVQDDIDRFSFNTSVSNFMICVNELTDLKCNKRAILEPLTILIAPYAPHIAEELWEKLGHKQSIAYAQWPVLKEEYLVESAFNYPVSFNGKTRFFHEFDLSLSKEAIEKEVLTLNDTLKYLEGKSPKKIIVVPGRIVNIVV